MLLDNTNDLTEDQLTFLAAPLMHQHQHMTCLQDPDPQLGKVLQSWAVHVRHCCHRHSCCNLHCCCSCRCCCRKETFAPYVNAHLSQLSRSRVSGVTDTEGMRGLCRCTKALRSCCDLKPSTQQNTLVAFWCPRVVRLPPRLALQELSPEHSTTVSRVLRGQLQKVAGPPKALQVNAPRHSCECCCKAPRLSLQSTWTEKSHTPQHLSSP